MLTCELVKSMPTRRWQMAMMMKVRPRGGGLVSSQAVDVVDAITLIQTHWPSSKKKTLTWRDQKSGIATITQLAGDHGIVFGDLNIPKKNSLEDLFAHAEPAGQWRMWGNKLDNKIEMHGPDWVIYRKCFQRGDDGGFQAERFYSDAHHPVCFMVSSGLARSQAANEVADIARSAMTRSPLLQAPGAPSTEARHTA